MPYPTGRKTEELHVADFNNDGLLDIAACNSYFDVAPASGDVSIYLGVGEGRLGKETRAQVGEHTEGIAVGHFDQDSFLDLATADYGGGSLSILLGGPGGPVTLRQTLDLGPIGPRDVVAEDVNRDGVLDLIYCAMDTNEVGVALGSGVGTFDVHATRVGVGDGPEVLAVVRANSDDVMDLVTANRRSDSLTILHGDENGGFRAVHEIAAGDRPRHVLAADLDGDGLDDLLGSSHRDGRVTVFQNVAGQHYSRVTTLSAPGLRGAICTAVEDLDGDGLEDVAASFHLSGCVAIFPGRGGFVFATPQVVPIGISTLCVAVADLSRDGLMDLVVGNPLADRLQVYLQHP